jgi:hypothetical protein
VSATEFYLFTIALFYLFIQHTDINPIQPSTYMCLDSDSGGQQEEQAECKSSTLTWTKRATIFADWNVSHEAFALKIGGVYNGRIPMRYVKVGRIIRSPDKEFTVTHGDVKTHTLALTWRGQQFKFADVDYIRTNLTDREYIYELDYWCCLKV